MENDIERKQDFVMRRIELYGTALTNVLNHRYNALTVVSGLASTLLVVATFNDHLIPLTNLVRVILSVLLLLIPVSIGGLIIATRKDMKQLTARLDSIVHIDTSKSDCTSRFLGYLPELVVGVISVCVILIISLIWSIKISFGV